jgi:cephalosporin hydroxylase
MDRHMAADEYLLIEDGICNSFNNEARYDGGPIRAIAEFLGEQPLRYEIDTRFCDFFGYNVTWNPNGYLRRLP